MIAALVTNGTVSLLAIAVIAVEVPLLLALAAGRAAFVPAAVVANGLSGICLLLALRAALTDAAPGAVALWLGLGFAAHLADIAARLKRK